MWQRKTDEVVGLAWDCNEKNVLILIPGVQGTAIATALREVF